MLTDRVVTGSLFARFVMGDITRLYPSATSEQNESETCEDPSIEDGLVHAFGDLAALPVEAVDRRPTCLRCW